MGFKTPTATRPARHSLVAAFALLATVSIARAADLTVTTDHANGQYSLGEPIHWTITAPPGLTGAKYTLKLGQVVDAGAGDLDLSSGSATVDSKINAPGTLLLEVRATAADGKAIRALGGAVAGADKIALSAARPADFDAFWDAKIKELHAVPPNPQLEPAGPSTRPAGPDAPTIDYWKITLDNIRGTHIRGQLARPRKGDKLPAMLIVQWAGVYPLNEAWVTQRANEGWLALNILAHDLPSDQPAKFYADQFAGPLKDYWSIGNDDRDKSYFLRMYLSCYQAADYLASRPDWDGKTLVVMGGSQGGQQTLVTAGLHPKITAALANVPAGCDMLGLDVGRKPGWPQWNMYAKGKNVDRIREASRYFDTANFASRIKCPTLIGLGLIDETCPAAGVFAAANQIPGDKELIILPRGDHGGSNDSHAAYLKRSYGEWLPALKAGKSPPPSTAPAASTR